jgi:hypothetical protein
LAFDDAVSCPADRALGPHRRLYRDRNSEPPPGTAQRLLWRYGRHGLARGQFNLDFLSLLTLSAVWVAWRHQFSVAGLGLAALALFGGGLFLTAYLFILSVQSRGNVKEVLLGKPRATA